jgi:hypothetical protein
MKSCFSGCEIAAFQGAVLSSASRLLNLTGAAFALSNVKRDVSSQTTLRSRAIRIPDHRRPRSVPDWESLCDCRRGVDGSSALWTLGEILKSYDIKVLE